MKQFTKNICLIGSSDLLIYFAAELLKIKINVTIISSETHSASFLNNKNFQILLKSKIDFKIIKNINKIKNLRKIFNKSSTAICFGSRWIFSEKIINFFSGRIYNVHPMPLPKYMGGAHYTWQILNKNKEGGVFLQKITKKLDCGPILFNKKYTLTNKDILPKHYFQKSLYFGKLFIDQIIKKLKNNKNFEIKNFKKRFEKREYFPRLMTKKNAFINWNWSARDILLFCNSFDSPYPGAMTFHGKNLVFFKGVKLHNSNRYHPFAAGLVLKKNKEKLYVITVKGTLEIRNCFFNNRIINKKIKQGDRFYTPSKNLDEAAIFKPKYK